MTSVSPARPGHLTCHRLDPFRTAQWRWDLARAIAEPGGRLPPHNPDTALAAAVDYLRRRRRARSAAAVDRAHPEITAAHALWERDEPLRWQLEARLLAGETPAAIAERVGVTPGVVETYNELFFDVRHCLEAESWILFEVLGLGTRAGRTPTTELMYKVFGYFAGAAAVDLLVAAHEGRANPVDRDGVPLVDKMSLLLELELTPAADYKTVARIFRRMSKVFPWGFKDQRGPDPMWPAYRAVIKLAAGGGRRRYGRRRRGQRRRAAQPEDLQTLLANAIAEAETGAGQSTRRGRARRARRRGRRRTTPAGSGK